MYANLFKKYYPIIKTIFAQNNILEYHPNIDITIDQNKGNIELMIVKHVTELSGKYSQCAIKDYYHKIEMKIGSYSFILK